MVAGKLKKDYFLYMGRLSTEKGLFVLLNASKLVPAAKFKIAGGGEQNYIEKMKAYIKMNDLNNVELLGHVVGNEKIELIRRAKALIVPSIWYEPCTLVIPEALSYGLPIMASNIGGIPEAVKGRKNCVLFKPGDYKELAEIIKATIVSF
jgi:glycosyltransferase involved in cell wall biosynthesis